MGNNAHSEKEIIRETICDMIDPFAEKRNETKIIEHVTLNNATATSGNAVTEERQSSSVTSSTKGSSSSSNTKQNKGSRVVVVKKVSGNQGSARVTGGTSVAVEKESRREIICDMVNPFAEKESKAEL